MKIVLSKDILKLFENRNFKSLVKIIKISSKSSLISIKGKLLEIPFVLNGKSSYIAEIGDGTLKLKEKDNNLKQSLGKLKKNKIDSEILKDISKKIENLFFSKDKKDESIESELKSFIFSSINNKIDNDRDNKRKNSYHLKKKDSDEYFFCLNTLFYNRLAKVFLKIKRKNVFLNIYIEKFDNVDNNRFIDEIKNASKGIINSFAVNITNDYNEFYNRVTVLLGDQSVDLEI